ncbi:hypothetical protein PR048_029749 [Dryococelus australis]|uniref:Uncharacterized protein n=1 Tax=Dryococelus australis TaxID=614101 RepID=A0ABQ9GE88_9NEOP|nr:hypothetical protein PR048_029749 [Dryococelus australis]
MTEKVEVLASHLEHAENRLQHALALAHNVDSNSSKYRLFISMCHDMPNLKINFENDHLTFELKCKTNVDFDQTKHTEGLDEFYDLYLSILAVLYTVSCNSKSGNALKGPTSSSHVMLPSNKLPHFTGNLAAWINFSNLFEIVIVNNQDLSKVEQLTYLKLDLKGCLALLVKQYDNKLLIMIHHTDTILQVLVAHLDSTAFMRYLLSKMNENMAALKALKLAVDQWDILLLDLLEKSVRVDLRKM